jgi:hypothetical protein
MWGRAGGSVFFRPGPAGVSAGSGFPPPMLLIRRMIDRRRAYTALLLPGEPPRIFPTSDHEHARILEIYLQDRPHTGIENDFNAVAALRRAALPSR